MAFKNLNKGDSRSALDFSEAESRIFVFNVSVHTDASVAFSPRMAIPVEAYRSTPFTTYSVNETLDGSRKVKVKNAICGGGSAFILELPSDTQYLVSVFRDAFAPRCPNTLDISEGSVDTKDPIAGVIRESVEEVLVLSKGSVVIPQFTKQPWAQYNDMIHKRVSYISGQFEIEATHKVPIRAMGLKKPLHVAGKNDLSISLQYEGKRSELSSKLSVTWLNLLTPPMLIKQEALGDVTFRETLALETHGAVPERNVVLIKIKGDDASMPGVIVYHEGERLREYPTFDEYLSENFVSDALYTPVMGMLLRSLGDEGHASLRSRALDKLQ
jgi:hypothetical protein